ncbi:hypothetical protein C2857_002147 [Epichloe festucae Fl1]|uniref:F-box domain-containing protein n=1 Tax=Epichloe festucae (strain Fl1) TaxID=877507 RepID=A0A7S9PTD6_EPIFF|nr:hypothetical protein C2857_002147 [Epichloe festucae Fl1]
MPVPRTMIREDSLKWTYPDSSNTQQVWKPHWRSTATMPSSIEQLPRELQEMVFIHLDYQMLIRLSTVNRYFQQIIDPQRMASDADKVQFIMRAAKDFPQHRPSERGHDFRPGNFECYICFRVRSPDNFDMLQPQSAFLDLRGCIVQDREPDPRIDAKTSGFATVGEFGRNLVVSDVPIVGEIALYDLEESLSCDEAGRSVGSRRLGIKLMDDW